MGLQKNEELESSIFFSHRRAKIFTLEKAQRSSYADKLNQSGTGVSP